MNPTSQIKIPNGTILDLKDADARNSISNLDQRVTALENATTSAGKFIRFNGSRLREGVNLKTTYPDIIYFVDGNDNAIARFIYQGSFIWEQTCSKSVNTSAGVHEMNLGNLGNIPELEPKNFATLYPNFIYQFDSLVPNNMKIPFDQMSENFKIYGALSDGLVYTSEYTDGTGRFLYNSNTTGSNNLSLTYQHKYNQIEPVYQEIADPANQIYISDVGFHTGYIHIRANKALAITDVKVYNESNHDFDNCVLYDNNDYNPVSDNLFYIHETGTYQQNAYIYKFTFSNNDNTFWSIITSNYKLHA